MFNWKYVKTETSLCGMTVITYRNKKTGEYKTVLGQLWQTEWELTRAQKWKAIHG